MQIQFYGMYICRAGLLDDAAMVAKMAIEAAPKFVVTHFTLANILASKVSYSFSIKN
jgi:hypothetical protein